MLKIDNISISAPSEAEIRYKRVSSDVERNALGEAVIDFIATKRELRLQWAYLPKSEWEKILGALESGFVEVECPIVGDAMTCYCEDRSVGVKQMRGTEPVYTEAQLTLLER